MPRSKKENKKILDTKQAKKIVKKFALKLKEEKFPFEAIYLFGSLAQDKGHEWSDIDVAVISDRFKKNFHQNENILWHLRKDIDSMIEPIAFTKTDFTNQADPIISEIKKTGIKIA